MTTIDNTHRALPFSVTSNKEKEKSEKNIEQNQVKEPIVKSFDVRTTDEDNLVYLEHQAKMNQALLPEAKLRTKSNNSNLNIANSIKSFEAAYSELKNMGLTESESLTLLDLMSESGVLA